MIKRNILLDPVKYTVTFPQTFYYLYKITWREKVYPSSWQKEWRAEIYTDISLRRKSEFWMSVSIPNKFDIQQQPCNTFTIPPRLKDTRTRDFVTLAHGQSSFRWGDWFLSRAPVEAQILRSFSTTVCCTYRTHITWAARNERQTGQRVGRYPPRITQTLVHNYVDYISDDFLRLHRKLQPSRSDSVLFVCTNKVRMKEKNFLSARKKRNNINWCSTLSLSVNAIRANDWLSISDLRQH